MKKRFWPTVPRFIENEKRQKFFYRRLRGVLTIENTHCANDKIISLGPKRSTEKTFQKKAVLTMIKTCAQFSSYYQV